MALTPASSDLARLKKTPPEGGALVDLLGAGVLPVATRSCLAGESMVVDAKRLAVGRMAQRLPSGYYSFLVAHLVAVNPESINSLPPAKILGEDPTGEIKRK